jgi:hypothetical protein
MPNTTLWHVGLLSKGPLPTVVVSNKPIQDHCIEQKVIRSITAKAAGRRYIRNNLTMAIASIDLETYGFTFRDYELDPLTLKPYKKYTKNAVMEIRKV